jgi:hypothetical protein
MDAVKIMPVKPGHVIELPADWVAELKLGKAAALERTAEGILVRPYPSPSWDDVFAGKLTIGGATNADRMTDEIDASGDDLLL